MLLSMGLSATLADFFLDTIAAKSLMFNAFLAALHAAIHGDFSSLADFFLDTTLPLVLTKVSFGETSTPTPPFADSCVDTLI